MNEIRSQNVGKHEVDEGRKSDLENTECGSAGSELNQ
jgi:hypothetical protein